MTAPPESGGDLDGPPSDAAAHLRLTAWQYAVLLALLGLVGIISWLGVASTSRVADTSIDLAQHLQNTTGDSTGLERQLSKLRVDVDAWRDGVVDQEQVELSIALVQRQLQTGVDEERTDPLIADQHQIVDDSVQTIIAVVGKGVPAPLSVDAVRLDAALDDALAAARTVVDAREVESVERLFDLEDEVEAAKSDLGLAAGLVLVLVGMLIALLRRIQRSNYRRASLLLEQESRRYLEARAGQDRAEALAKIQTEILELVATDRPTAEVFARISDRTAEHLPGIVLRFCSGSDPSDPSRSGAVPMAARESSVVLGELEWTCAEGTELPADFQLIVTFAAGLGALALDRQEAAEAMVFQATHDPLTGLPNRSLFSDKVEAAIERSRHSDSRIAVLFMDLDRFKVINDTFGHEAGDQILIHVARCLMSGVRASDTVARLAGDEFVVLMEDVGDLEQVERTAQRVQSHLQEPVEVSGITMQLASSIGIALGDDDSGVEELLRNADAAMYRAKSNGRDRFEFFDEALRDWTERRNDLEIALRTAIDNREFEAHFQPLYAASDLTISGFEALVRWDRPGVGLVSPGEFIEVAEELGLIGQIDGIMMEAAVHASKAFRAIDPEVTVGINVSARDLMRPDFADRVEQVLDETGADAEGIVLEITETVLVEDAEAVTEPLSRLRDRGLRVAIDDFGTGYSSLRYLRDLPADILKIDRAFVSGSYDAELADPPIVASVIDLGHAVGLEVIAEGVETPAQLEAIQILEADVVQGFLLSRPVEFDEAMGMLSEGQPAGVASTAS